MPWVQSAAENIFLMYKWMEIIRELRYQFTEYLTGYLRDIYGIFTGYLRDIYGIFTGYLRDIYGIFTGYLTGYLRDIGF